MKKSDIEIFDLALSKFYSTTIDLHCTEKMIAFRRFRLLRFVKTPQISGDVLTNQRRAPPIGKTGQTKNALICAAKCGTLSARKVRPQPGNIREWKDDYGLLSFGRYDGADRLRACDRRCGDLPRRGDDAPRDRGVWHGGAGVRHPELCRRELRGAKYKAADDHEARRLPRNDLERIEKLNALSRRICAEVQELAGIERWTALA